MPDDSISPNDPSQVEALTHELQAVITRFRKEYDLTLASYIGALEIVKLSLFHEQSHLPEADTP